MRDDSSSSGVSNISDAHLRYARWLARGTTFGFVVMAIAFAVYVGGALEPHVALADLPSRWREPAASYLAATGIAHGWGWFALMHKADMLNLAGVAILSGCSAVPLLALIPLYARERNRVFVAVCALEIAVIALAASNLFTAGH